MTLTKDQVESIPKMVRSMTIKEVADYYQVHERTINKWIRKLREAGHEVQTRVGRRPIQL